mmetsp:Transcript_13229/g.32100  ORF Transcript_13229/g.32100 Transcript_13229/m.32100 type:complete len:252 (+) Transcript_13229:193-948(+)
METLIQQRPRHAQFTTRVGLSPTTLTARSSTVRTPVGRRPNLRLIRSSRVGPRPCRRWLRATSGSCTSRPTWHTATTVVPPRSWAEMCSFSRWRSSRSTVPRCPRRARRMKFESLDASAGFHAAGHARNHLTQHSSSCACTMSMSRTTVAGKAVIARHVQHLRRRSRDQAHTACMLEVPVTGHKVVTQRKPKRSERRTLPRARPKSNQVPTRAAVTATAGRRTSPARCELRRVCRHSVRDTRAVKNESGDH